MTADIQNHPLAAIRRKPLLKKVGVSNTQLYVLMEEQGFPRPISLGARSVAWIESEVDAWLAQRMEARA